MEWAYGSTPPSQAHIPPLLRKHSARNSTPWAFYRLGKSNSGVTPTTPESCLEAIVLSSPLRLAGALLLFCLAPSISSGQEATSTASSDQQATIPRIAGVFVYPVPDAPFSATVEINSRQKLADGSVYDSVHRTTGTTSSVFPMHWTGIPVRCYRFQRRSTSTARHPQTDFLSTTPEVF